MHIDIFFLSWSVASKVPKDFSGGGSQQQLVPRCAAFEKLHGAGWLPGGCWDGAGKVEWVQRVGYRRAVPVRSGYISTVKRCCIMLYLNSWGFRTYLYTPICNLNCTPKVAMETHGCFPCTGSTFMIMNLVAFFCHRFHIYGFNQSTLGF